MAIRRWCYLLALLATAVWAADETHDYYVWGMPGLDESQVKLYDMHAGQIMIKPQDNGSLFFWHVKSEYTVTETRKTIIWLNGGPGCSSMDGALMEIGPYRVKDGKLVANEGAWNQYASLLFVDQPVGVGFSTIETSSYIHTLSEMADDFMVFLDKYFELFPDQLADDLYLAGESYAGQYIPYIAERILKRNSQKEAPYTDHDVSKKHINLQGVIIGNGWFDPVSQYLTYLPFAYSAGLLKQGSPEAKGVEALHKDCAEALNDLGGNVTIHVPDCERVADGIINAVRGDSNECINVYDVRLTDSYPACGMNWPPDLQDVQPYLRQDSVKAALNSYVTGTSGWSECSRKVQVAMNDDRSPPSVSLLPGIADEIPVMLFTGDKDFICNRVGQDKMIANLEWNGGRGFDEHATKTVWQVNGKDAGEVMSSRNLTHAVVYDSSHMVPYTKPEQAQFLCNVFTGVLDWSGNPTSSTILQPGGKPSSGPTKEDKDKIISEATWRAYYRAGGVALVVLVIVLSVLGLVLWRNHRRKRLMYGSQEQGFWKSLLGGFSRWNPAGHRRSVSGSFKFPGRSNHHPRRSNVSDIILEEDEDEEGVPLTSVRQDNSDEEERVGNDSLEEIVVQKPR